MKAESFFKGKVEPPEAETRWEKMKKPVISFLEKAFQGFSRGIVDGQIIQMEKVNMHAKRGRKIGEKAEVYSEELSKTLSRGADLKMGFIFTVLDAISELYDKVGGFDGIPLSKDESSSENETSRHEESDLDVANASLEVPADEPTEEQKVMTKLDELKKDIETLNTSITAMDEKALTEDSINDITNALLRIEGSLSMTEITQALGNLQTAMENITTEKGADGVTNKDLSDEIQDVKTTKEDDINKIKDQLAVLVKLIEKKAMTFDDIYKMVFRRLAHEHEMQTGRRIG